MSHRSELILWTGPKHSGKTAAAWNLIESLRAEGFTVAGLLAHSVYENGILVGFDALDLSTGRRARLLNRAGPGAATDVGPFAFNEEGLRIGRAALSSKATRKAELVVVDEFGPLELRGGLWRDAVDRLAAEADKLLLLVVREDLRRTVAEIYAPRRVEVVRAGDPLATRRILALMKKPP